jgi:hypothetical protein
MTRLLNAATQGHRYRMRSGMFKGRDVLCMEGGTSPRVSLLFEDGEWPFPSKSFPACLAELEPMPMVYFHGEIPR